MSRITVWLDEHRDFGALFVRLFMGTFLIYMSQDNVFDRARMLEFARFLRQFDVPLPLVSAHVSVYAQFVCAILIAIGAFTRVAAAVMIVNFVVALALVHTRLPFRESLDPSAMLAGALFLFFHGAGMPSVDVWRGRRSRAHAAVPRPATYSR